jgi:SAM-dependent methyltransferase
MTDVAAHYTTHLAPIYLWMVGGAETAFTAADAELNALNLPTHPRDLILDLGAGFGMHSIPLARRGARVIAIDSSEHLLAELNKLGAALNITTHAADLLDFPRLVAEPVSAILCMGDTLTHLPSPDTVSALFAAAHKQLAPGGRLILTFRDYTTALEGNARFIPVRSDENRIHTCFLEYSPSTILVHDILHERGASDWQIRVSSYPKLRLAPDALIAELNALGFTSRREPGPRGMVRIIAVN